MIFNPTRTEDWLRCPVYSSMKRTWCAPDDTWTPNMLLGSMMHAGAAAFMKAQAQTDIELAMEAEMLAYIEQDKWPAAMVRDLARKAYNCLVARLTIILELEQEQVIGVEVPLMAADHHPAVDRVSQADLITLTSDGLIITDYKYSLQVDPKYRLKRLQEYDASFQLWCYAWEAEQMRERTNWPAVAWLRIIQVIGLPKASVNHTTIRVTPARLKFFERGAMAAWRGMAEEIDSGAEPTPNLTSCHGKYGKCTFYDPCHIANGDSAMIEAMGFTRFKRAEKGSIQ